MRRGVSEARVGGSLVPGTPTCSQYSAPPASKTTGRPGRGCEIWWLQRLAGSIPITCISRMRVSSVQMVTNSIRMMAGEDGGYATGKIGSSSGKVP